MYTELYYNSCTHSTRCRHITRRNRSTDEYALMPILCVFNNNVSLLYKIIKCIIIIYNSFVLMRLRLQQNPCTRFTPVCARLFYFILFYFIFWSCTIFVFFYYYFSVLSPNDDSKTRTGAYIYYDNNACTTSTHVAPSSAAEQRDRTSSRPIRVRSARCFLVGASCWPWKIKTKNRFTSHIKLLYYNILCSIHILHTY